MISQDRTYWHVPGAKAWHADADGVKNISVCGRWPRRPPQSADRIPPSAHLCGSCARIIAARTDVESEADEPGYGVTVPL